ncbi:hypothetical protein CW751_02290 [Brumimicrobium salinarum]|uniref:PKD domain-containing protein n=1 Tax=Brumimicrobium salinarum TaxID=2058658 RepID=A0A2I0R6H2_9FLAO|nr:gliding motility-associated C-terminal domain-containing protein [Brumimicrobium salinarum]PKR82181.1 hypothetical protein CW751_02290 [Brumimicrobium salinarum]
MKILITIFAVLFSWTLLFGQTINIQDADFDQSNPIDCSVFNDASVANFFDDGGTSGDYSPGTTETITICPDNSGDPKIRAFFGNSPGFTWDVHGSDTLFVYDGPNTSSPRIAALNNGTIGTGFTGTASWANTSGCLTFEFVSDGANNGTGWDANILCFSPPQDIEMHVEAFINGTPGNDMFPLDTGYVDICQGDSVLLVAKPIFPYSFENTNEGYSQNINNVDYLWEFTDGTLGPNNDSIWFNPNNEGGFIGYLRITDSYPSNETIKFKIRTSITPTFAGTGPIEDTVCFSGSTELFGGVTSADTVGVSTNEGSFQLGGSVAGETYLPDGSGVTYSTTINMSGFPAGATFANAGDLVEMCVDMEHSFLGDLEMWLTCPNGTEVTIFNSSTQSAGYIPGGFGGGGRFLGEPDVSGGSGPGNGYEYCFSSVNNNWGDFASEYLTNTIPLPPTAPSQNTLGTMDPNGIYAPEDSYIGFAGCPLNGNWTLNIRDSWGGDDGYIFEWGLYFDPSLFPDNEFYQNTITDAYWSQDPTIVSDTTNDTLIVIEPDGIGDYFYTFNVEDDFGCFYDTIVQLHVQDTVINISTLDTSAYCFNDSIPLWVEVDGTVPPFQIEWQDGQQDSVAYYSVLENGYTEYVITVTDECGISHRDTASITMNQTLSIDSLNQFPADCGLENGAVLGFGSGFTGTPDYNWRGPGAENPSNTQSTAWPDKAAGWYYFRIKDDVCTVRDSILLEQNPPPEASFTATPTQGPAPLDVIFTNTSDPASQYDWDFGNGDGNIVNDLSTQYSNYPDEGVYTVVLTITEGACTDEATQLIDVFLPVEYDMVNSFTPNGDGVNDFFTVNASNTTSFEIVILNRWGNVVFESDNPNFQWDGTVDNNGTECNDGTYFYKFIIEGAGGESKEEHGFVHLLRGTE